MSGLRMNVDLSLMVIDFRRMMMIFVTVPAWWLRSISGVPDADDGAPSPPSDDDFTFTGLLW